MANMIRNVNLEEIDTDSFMQIPFLQYQSFGQKIVFWGSVLCAVGVAFVSTFFLSINSNIAFILAIFPLLIGIAFGGNYNEDYSIIKYFFLYVSKSYKAYYSKPFEDLEQFRGASDRIREEDAKLEKKQNQMSEEEQRKKMIILIVAFVIFTIGFVIFKTVANSSDSGDTHHSVMIEYQISGDVV